MCLKKYYWETAMIINYDVKKIDRALRDFYNATGIDMEFLKPDFTPASKRKPTDVCYCIAAQKTEAGKAACTHSDALLLEKCRESRKTETHLCHAGLLNVAIPLFYDDLIIGYLIFGRIKPGFDSLPCEEYMKKLGLTPDIMKEHYNAIVHFSDEKIESISNIAIMLAKYILLKNMLSPSLNDGLGRAVEYIQSNLSKDLSIKEIAKNANTSKSVLYRNFRSGFGCTVSEYVNKKRIERAIDLMENTDASIEEISQNTGFSSAAYFSRTFKNRMGISPIKYKKQIKK